MQKFVFVILVAWSLFSFGQGQDVLTPKMEEVQKHLCAVDPKSKTEGTTCPECAAKGMAAPIRDTTKTVREKAEAQARDLAFFEWVQNNGMELGSDIVVYLPGGGFLLGADNAKKAIEYRGRDLKETEKKIEDYRKIESTLQALEKDAAFPEDAKTLLLRPWSDRAVELKGRLVGGKKILKSYESTVSLKKGTPEGATAEKNAGELRTELAEKSVRSEKMQALVASLQSGSAKGGTPELAAVLQQVGEDLRTFEAARDGFKAEIKKQEEALKDQVKQWTAAKDAELKNARKMSNADRLKRYEERFRPEIDRMLKHPGYQDCGLSMAERFALYLYSEGGYKIANPALWGKDKKKRKEVEPYAKVFSSALKKLAPYQGEVLRGALELPASVLAEHQVGKTVTYGAYTSTALEKPFAGKIQFVIESKKGRYISPFSTFWYEGEVLFDAGTKFKITKREDTAQGVKIWMTEVSP